MSEQFIHTPKPDMTPPKNIPRSVAICTGLFAIFVCGAFIFLLHKIQHVPFFHFGPSDNLHFFHVAIDSWGKWFTVIFYVIFSTLCASMVTEIVLPFVMTQIQDVSKPNPAKEWQMYLLVQIYYMSWSIQTVITTYLYFSQLDIVLTQMIVYNIVSFFTTRHYIHIKKRVVNVNTDYGSVDNIL